MTNNRNQELVNEIFHKQALYEINILNICDIISPESHKEFSDWLKSKAVELGTGSHTEYYYDELKEIDIEVSFKVRLI